MNRERIKARGRISNPIARTWEITYQDEYGYYHSVDGPIPGFYADEADSIRDMRRAAERLNLDLEEDE